MSAVYRGVMVLLATGCFLSPIKAMRAQHAPGGSMPAEGGQSAFAAISEVVRLLEADSTTDWSKVNLEALRQHLIDMDLVTMRARVTATWVPGGEMWAVQGTGPVVAAIKRMTAAHVAMMGGDPTLSMHRRELADGVLVTVRAADPANTALITKIRALDFIGFMASGSHHQMHHLMLARGLMSGHGH